jgi:chromosome segregation ATPase
MSENSQSETAGEHVAAIVEGVEAAAAAAIEGANERAAAAEHVAALVAEGAIQRTIQDDIDECNEELAECLSGQESLRTQIAALQSEVANLSASLSTFLTMEILTAELAKLSPQPSIPKTSSETETVTETVTHSPGDGDGRPAAEPESKAKPKRFHLT